MALLKRKTLKGFLFQSIFEIEKNSFKSWYIHASAYRKLNKKQPCVQNNCAKLQFIAHKIFYNIFFLYKYMKEI